jgi:uncharacterized NAD-dependent epimerase/dehydratase family protein
MQQSNVIVLTNGMLDTLYAKTCHGLLRGSDRFNVIAVIDPKFAGQDAGTVMDGKPLNIPVVASVEAFMASEAPEVHHLIVGVAIPGGKLPEDFREEISNAIQAGFSIISGLHTFVSDDPEFASLAEIHQVSLFDVRKPKDRQHLGFWSGAIHTVKAPRIAVLGMDCAVGKRTTCRFLLEACRSEGIKAEMIYTGQTGWMQGYKHGFIFDSTVNDFIGGEVERSIVECYREENPDLILIEGQSALQNPTGPCGSEFILCGQAKGVVLQHIPGREHYEDTKIPIRSIESEIRLIEAYGAEVLAITLNGTEMTAQALKDYQARLAETVDVPVIRPLEEGVAGLMPVIRQFMARQKV